MTLPPVLLWPPLFTPLSCSLCPVHAVPSLTLEPSRQTPVLCPLPEVIFPQTACVCLPQLCYVYAKLEYYKGGLS